MILTLTPRGFVLLLVGLFLLGASFFSFLGEVTGKCQEAFRVLKIQVR